MRVGGVGDKSVAADLDRQGQSLHGSVYELLGRGGILRRGGGGVLGHGTEHERRERPDIEARNPCELRFGFVVEIDSDAPLF